MVTPATSSQASKRATPTLSVTTSDKTSNGKVIQAKALLLRRIQLTMASLEYLRKVRAEQKEARPLSPQGKVLGPHPRALDELNANHFPEPEVTAFTPSEECKGEVEEAAPSIGQRVASTLSSAKSWFRSSYT